MRPVKHVPNVVPGSIRARNIAGSVLILAHGAFGLWKDDLWIPGKRRVHHFHGASAVVMFGALVALCAFLISVVVDHYDRRDNEHRYQWFALASKTTGFVLALAAVVTSVITWLIRGRL